MLLTESKGERAISSAAATKNNPLDRPYLVLASHQQAPYLAFTNQLLPSD
ncbi:hypothetical protein [Synechococcus sp. MVIR-18-1]|nr:hypothetical protein [Synechococcus sp. MVIR-18-1]QNI75912.1 hypothetical protein SynMVIR181_00926 [Synechococcus sp. MVIR-18-1]